MRLSEDESDSKTHNLIYKTHNLIYVHTQPDIFENLS